MKRITFILISVLISAYCLGQYEEATRNYDLGNKYLTQKDYGNAIKYYTTSLQLYPAADAYFNRALSYIHLHDTCNYCKDIKNAARFYDYEAFTLYKKNCCSAADNHNLPDSIKIQVPEATHLEILHDLFGKDSTIYVISEENGSLKAIEISTVCDYNVFTVVEDSPSFPGGEEARVIYLRKNVNYPKDAKKNYVQGIVVVSFVVEKDGSLTDIKILQGIGAGCDAEVIRAVQNMPRWIPGKQKGKPVRVRFNLPVMFTLAG